MGPTTMHTRRLLLLAPLVLLGCQTGFEECGKYNWFLCAYNNATDGEAESDSDTPTTTITETTGSLGPCGDGNVQVNEDCDDGNADNTDDCIQCVSARCGDAFVRAKNETCDDGDATNTANGWEMKETCKVGCMGYADYCGDGTVNGPEVCDDGVDNSDAYTDKSHCNAGCTAMVVDFCGDGVCQSHENLMTCPQDCTSFCGDKKLQAGELCDEGMDTMTCDGDCSTPACGDGYLNMAANEACDDGNQTDTDACRMDCTNAFCGDGVLQAGVEACDDGNQTDDDECSKLCVPARRVFVSTGKYDAELIKGVAGADMLCKTAGAGLAAPGDTWLAWLSDDSSSPSNRVAEPNKNFTGWYLLPNGTPVAKGWSGLTSGSLVNPINLTEAGMMPSMPFAAWTNTKTDGASEGEGGCTKWTSPDLTTSGKGDITSKASAWTQDDLAQCAVMLHLYCLEVSP